MLCCAELCYAVLQPAAVPPPAAVPWCAEPVLCSHDTHNIGGVAQGNILPAGLDLGSISALAAALGVQSVAMPGFALSPPTHTATIT